MASTPSCRKLISSDFVFGGYLYTQMQFPFVGTFPAQPCGYLEALCGNEGTVMAFPEKSWCVTVCWEVSYFEQGGAFSACIRPTSFTEAFLWTLKKHGNVESQLRRRQMLTVPTVFLTRSCYTLLTKIFPWIET